MNVNKLKKKKKIIKYIIEDLEISSDHSDEYGEYWGG